MSTKIISEHATRCRLLSSSLTRFLSSVGLMEPKVNTGVSQLGALLSCSLFSVDSVVVCSSVVDSTGSYSPGFISRSGREPVSDSASTYSSASLIGLVVRKHLFKVFYFLLRHWVMPIFFANVWNISIMCGMSSSSVVVVPITLYVNNDDPEVLVVNISNSSKNRMTLFMKLNLYGFVIAWKQVAHAVKA